MPAAPHIQDTVAANLSAVRQRMADAARRAGRDPGSIRLVAVTKYAPKPAIAALLALGQRDLGENRVQQLVARAEEFGADVRSGFASRSMSESAPIWHLIGHLQRNKCKAALAVTRNVHSVDSERLVETLSAQAVAAAATVDVLLELNIAGEASKSGASRESAERLLIAASRAPGLTVRGWMTMAPYTKDPRSVRPVFAQLREVRDSYLARGVAPATATELSMGMSGDFEVAIEEGATVVRVGSALFEGVASE